MSINVDASSNGSNLHATGGSELALKVLEAALIRLARNHNYDRNHHHPHHQTDINHVVSYICAGSLGSNLLATEDRLWAFRASERSNINANDSLPVRSSRLGVRAGCCWLPNRNQLALDLRAD